MTVMSMLEHLWFCCLHRKRCTTPRYQWTIFKCNNDVLVNENEWQKLVLKKPRHRLPDGEPETEIETKIKLP